MTAGVRSLDRAVAVLDAFTPARAELGVSEMARATGLSRSTAHRLLASLESHELVQQVSPSGRYTLGPHLLRLAHAVQRARADVPLQTLARPAMTRLRDEADETVGLHVSASTRHRMVIDQVESRQQLRRTYTDLGSPIPIHQGAPGKALLAFAPEDVREHVLSSPLEAATKGTITDPRELRLELARVQEAGYARSLEERVPGVSGLAAPIRDYAGVVVAALSVSGPSSRLTHERLLTFVPAAMTAAGQISTNLGYAPSNERPASVP